MLMDQAILDTRLSAHFFHEGEEPALDTKIFRFRYELFCKQHGWLLNTKDGIERDDFDTPQTVHCALLSGEDVAGYFRFNRCDKAYFSAQIFPYLATKQSYPFGADYWDVSRFGINRDYKYLSMFLYGLLFRFAVGQDAKGLVCIFSPARERQLTRLGLKMRRYGAPLAIDVDSKGRFELAMAGEVPMTEQNFSILRPMIDLTRHMEIKDDTFIFRLRRSAA